jgi:RNA polymerase sigma-70 factor (ECF subfamily)
VDEKDLVSRCAAGEDAAWQEFVQRYAPVLKSFARGALRSMRQAASDSDVDEVAAKVLEMLVDNRYHILKSFRWQCSLETWLRILVRTACVRAIRRKTPEKEDLVKTGGATPLDEALSDEARFAVREALSELPDRERQVLSMFFIEGFSYDEIASKLGLPMGTVATVLSRTRAKLRDMLKSKGLTGM